MKAKQFSNLDLSCFPAPGNHITVGCSGKPPTASWAIPCSRDTTHFVDRSQLSCHLSRYSSLCFFVVGSKTCRRHVKSLLQTLRQSSMLQDFFSRVLKSSLLYIQGRRVKVWVWAYWSNTSKRKSNSVPGVGTSQKLFCWSQFWWEECQNFELQFSKSFQKFC